MAWMKSSESGKYYLTGEFTQRSDVQKPEQVSAVLGFSAETVGSDSIKAELDRVAENRKQLIADIVMAIPAGSINLAAIAKAVNDDAAKRLAS